ncbi:MAG TPA: hypothetical protein VNI58_00850 [Mariprofundaceae bacterium]|nr:hypothetical protein [Mariprofundaceae bacterium]
MRARRHPGHDSIYEIFSDMALLMLAAFIFLFALILITSQWQGSRSQDTTEVVKQLKKELAEAEARNAQLQEDLATMAGSDVQKQIERVLESAGLATGKGKHDFDLFVDGLRNLPGKDIHLVVDATGSMHGVTTFLIPVLRVIVLRSGKRLAAVSWYADGQTGTYTGGMGEVLDKLMQKAPFVGTDETIGKTFRDITEHAPIPGAYMLIGDEPPTDTVAYHSIRAPVFTLPLGIDNDSRTKVAFKTIAEQTGGRMLQLKFH